MTPSLTAPPAPHSFFSRVASSASCASSRGSPLITVTPLPPRPATARPTRTRAGCGAVCVTVRCAVRPAGAGCVWGRSRPPHTPPQTHPPPPPPPRERLERLPMPPRSRLHVPPPPARPGQEPDFSYV